MQRRLLPDFSAPVGEFQLASLFLPCETLGGDFYDLARRREGGLLLVADAMGHGVEAALLTMLVKAAFVESVSSSDDPAAVLAAMGARLRRLMPECTFVAALVAFLGGSGGGMRLANAGLPHPFVLRSSERTVEAVRVNGCPLGLLDPAWEAPVAACEVTLAHGEVLLIASDGVGSVESARGRHFDEQRLRPALQRLAGRRGSDIVDGLAAEMVDFSRGRPFSDDINVIAVSRGGLRRDMAARSS